MVLCYFIAGILDTLWLGGINFIFMFGFWVCFVLLFVWLYTKYSGEYAEVGEYIDYFADVIWNNVRGKKWLSSFLKFCFIGFSTCLFPMFTFCNAICSWKYESRLNVEHFFC